MSRRAATHTQTDIDRALKAARTAGEDWAVELLSDGTIRLRRAEVLAGKKAEFDEEGFVRLC